LAFCSGRERRHNLPPAASERFAVAARLIVNRVVDAHIVLAQK
jgi:hypothetical protein